MTSNTQQENTTMTTMIETPTAPDHYFKKRITYTHQAHTFAFDVAHTIFSSFEIDTGSDLLLRTLALHDDTSPPRHILDLGCGCGVLGIVLARRYPDATVVMADRDLLAVRYARHNSHLNDVPAVQVYGSVGVEEIPDGPYDLIVSNIPAKIGYEAIEREFLLALRERLAPGGAFWFVVVSGLNHLIPRLGNQHNLRLKEMKKRSGHTVYRMLA